MAQGGWIYIMSNRRDGTLYLGVTSNLSLRIWQHRQGRGGGGLSGISCGAWA
jgi:putative endonuclease